MRVEYLVVVRGSLPSDLRERICRAHSEALAAHRSMRGAQAGGDGAQTEAQNITPKASAPADMLPVVVADATREPPDQSPP
ncbi:MAG: hypothetical protein Q8P22_11445 [Chloroflexota bacterium]|nr:hypothetical protein [Chloroflexota bacterium]